VHQDVNGLAVSSLVFALLWIGGLGSVLAIFMAHSAHDQIDDSMGRQTGHGLATAGLIIGWIGFLLSAVFIVFPMTMLLLG